MDRLIAPYRAITPDALSAVPYNYGTTGLAYNRKYISDEEMREKGARILIDAAHEGKIGGWSRLAHAHLVRRAPDRGRTPNDIQDMEAVWDAIRQHRDLALKYWTSRRRADEPARGGGDPRHRGLVGAASPRSKEEGPRHRLLRPAERFGWQECLFVIAAARWRPARSC